MSVTDSAGLGGTLFGGRWLVERALSSGGMGSIYVARHTDTGRSVALKVIKSDLAHDPELAARFRRETAALASLSHPNVVTFLDSGIESGNVYLVMELLEGHALREALGAPLPWARALKIGADVCRALAAVHKAGLVHRDLKPENVFLQEAEGHDEVVKLIDFGIVRHDAPQVTASTKTGTIVGTPGYISPEQLRGQPATPASDIYAVGVMLYEMVTGRGPFDAPDVHAMLVKQLIDPVTGPRAYAPELPKHVEDIILKLMERDPALRVGGARDALALLTGPAPPAPLTIAPRGTATETPRTSALPVPPVAPAPRPRKRAALLALAVALPLLAIGAAVFARTRVEPPVRASVPALSAAAADPPASVVESAPESAAAVPVSATSAPAVPTSVAERAPVTQGGAPVAGEALAANERLRERALQSRADAKTRASKAKPKPVRPTPAPTGRRRR